MSKASKAVGQSANERTQTGSNANLRSSPSHGLSIKNAHAARSQAHSGRPIEKK